MLEKHDSQGLDERWRHENAGELQQVRWAAYLLIRTSMRTSLREPHTRLHARKPFGFRVPFFFASVSFWGRKKKCG
jgi:hypothetical protein